MTHEACGVLVTVMLTEYHNQGFYVLPLFQARQGKNFSNSFDLETAGNILNQAVKSHVGMRLASVLLQLHVYTIFRMVSYINTI